MIPAPPAWPRRSTSSGSPRLGPGTARTTLTIASAYLANEDLARREGRVERFFINLVLVRVLYAHALVAAPRLALGWLAPCGRLLGDPRLGMTGIFLSLSRVLPDRYPLDDDLSRYVDAEHSLGHLLDVGIIVPRLGQLYDWSAGELGLPALTRAARPTRDRPLPTRGTRRTRRSGTPTVPSRSSSTARSRRSPAAASDGADQPLFGALRTAQARPLRRARAVSCNRARSSRPDLTS